MGKYRLLIAAGLCLLVLTGCGSASLSDDINKTTVSVDAKGEVTAYLVESFDKDYYDISELMSMAVEDAAAYNTEMASGETVPVTVDKAEMLQDDTNVRIIYRFNSAETYSDYMEGVLFYGTVADALLAGFDLQASSFGSVKDGTLVTDEWIQKEAAQKHILITNQAATFYCPYKVTHISGNAVWNEDGSVSNPQSDENIYILLKK